MEKWIGPANLILAAIVSFTALITLLKFKSEQLSTDAKAMATKVETLMQDLQGVVTQLAVAQKEQAGINVMCAEALKSIIGRVEKLNDQVERIAEAVIELKADVRMMKSRRGE